MPAQKHNPDLLVAILNRLVTHPHCEIKATAREFKISPVTIFNWRAASARDEQADLKDASPFWVLWMDQASYWHRHLILARKLSILRIDERLRDLAVNGTKEFLFRQGGEPIWQVDAQLAADALDAKTWQERHGDRPITDVYRRGPDGELLQAYREVAPNPQLLIKAVSALLPEIYGERVQHDVTVGGVLRLGAPAAAPKPIAEADFTVLAETPDEIKPPSNVLAVAACPASVADYERQFGGKRLVEATLFYDADGRLQPPQPDIVIVDDSELNRAYNAAGIPHRTTSAPYLIAQGYCNPFLLKLATPAESDLVCDLNEKLAAGVKPPKASAPVPVSRPEDARGAPPTNTGTPTVPRGRASGRYDAEGLGRGEVPPGGYKVR
jgi:hypothetical protein